MALEHDALTEQVIGAATEVNRAFGPGFLEWDELSLTGASIMCVMIF